jgi:hypothetical protein
MDINKLLPYDLIIKMIIFIATFAIIFNISLFSINNHINREDQLKIKNYLKGLIINPETFYNSSLNFYNLNDINKAEREINYGLGLIGHKCNLSNEKYCTLRDLIIKRKEKDQMENKTSTIKY